MKTIGSTIVLCILISVLEAGLYSTPFAQAPPSGQERLGSDAKRPEAVLQPETDAPFKLPNVKKAKRTSARSDAKIDDESTIEIKGIKITGSTILDENELRHVAKKYEKDEGTFRDLLDLRDELTSIYIEGCSDEDETGQSEEATRSEEPKPCSPSSGAIIPPQEVNDGVFTIEIIEGGLEPDDIVIGPLKGLDKSFIKDRIRLDASKPLDFKRLGNRINLLLTDPAIQQINAAIGPGRQRGKSRLDLTIKEPPQREIEVGVANDRAPSVGAVRGSATYRVQNITGHSDPLTTEVGLGEGLRDIATSYSVPLTPKDVRFSIAANYSDSNVVEKPFNAVDVESKSWSVALGLSKPVIKTVNDEVSLDVSLERKRSTTFLLGERFSFAEGVQDGESNITALRFTQQWQHRGKDQALSLRSTESFGFNFLGATQNDADIPDGTFFSWLGQAQYALRIVPDTDWELALRGDVQLTPVGLLPIERIAIGGATTVRGYRENQLVTDNGWVASAELRAPVAKLDIPGLSRKPEDGQLSLVTFVDAGGGWNNVTPDPKDDLLLSAGAGFRWQIGSGVDLRLDVGVPLINVPDPPDRDLQDLGIHFGLRARFAM